MPVSGKLEDDSSPHLYDFKFILFFQKEEFLELAVWGHGIKLDISFFYVEKDYIWTGGVRASARQKVR